MPDNSSLIYIEQQKMQVEVSWLPQKVTNTATKAHFEPKFGIVTNLEGGWRQIKCSKIRIL